MMRRRRWFFLVLCFLLLALCLDVFFVVSQAYAQSKTPCVERDSKGRWKLKDSFCIQYEGPEYKEVVDRLKQLEHYKLHLEPACNLQKTEHKRLALSFDKSQENWKQQEKSYVELIKLARKGESEWRDQFYKLQKQKAPDKSWTEHPAFWYSLGIATVIALVAGSVALLNAIRPTGTVNTSLTFSRHPMPQSTFRASFSKPILTRKVLYQAH